MVETEDYRRTGPVSIAVVKVMSNDIVSLCLQSEPGAGVETINSDKKKEWVIGPNARFHVQGPHLLMEYKLLSRH